MYSRTRLFNNLPMDICFSSIHSFKSFSSLKLRITVLLFPSSAIVYYNVGKYIIVSDYEINVIIEVSFLYFYRLTYYDLTSLQRGAIMIDSAKEMPATEKTVTVMAQPAQIELSTNAKGQHQWTIKLYGESMDDGLLKQVLQIDEALSEKYKSERDVK